MTVVGEEASNEVNRMSGTHLSTLRTVAKILLEQNLFQHQERCRFPDTGLIVVNLEIMQKCTSSNKCVPYFAGVAGTNDPSND